MKLLSALDRACAAALRLCVVLGIVVVLVLLALGVFVRAVPIFSMAGYDEVIEFLFVWITFLGAMLLWREGALFRVEVVHVMLGPRRARVLDGIVCALMLVFAVVFTYEGWVYGAGTIEYTAFLMWPKNAWYMAMPISGALMVVYTVAAMWRIARGLPFTSADR